MVFAGVIITMTRFDHVAGLLMFLMGPSWYLSVQSSYYHPLLDYAWDHRRAVPSECRCKEQGSLMPKQKHLILTTGIIASWGCLHRWLSAMWCFSLSVHHMGEIVSRPSWVWFHWEINYFKNISMVFIHLIIPNLYSSRALVLVDRRRSSQPFRERSWYDGINRKMKKSFARPALLTFSLLPLW